MNSMILKGSLILILVSTTTLLWAQKKSTWVAPASANALKNPLAGNAASITEGKNIYSTTCSPCHGMKGRGDGAASAALDPKPADHSSAATQNQSDGALYWKLTEGKGPMLSYKAMYTDHQRWALVNYIRTLKK
jgi:mono/diheme cytochrome c family protein